MYMFGVGASLSAQDEHQAPAPTVLYSRASRASVLVLYSLDAVIWSSGIGAGPFTNGTSDEHVSSNANQKVVLMYNINYILQNSSVYVKIIIDK